MMTFLDSYIVSTFLLRTKNEVNVKFKIEKLKLEIKEKNITMNLSYFVRYEAIH